MIANDDRFDAVFVSSFIPSQALASKPLRMNFQHPDLVNRKVWNLWHKTNLRFYLDEMNWFAKLNISAITLGHVAMSRLKRSLKQVLSRYVWICWIYKMPLLDILTLREFAYPESKRFCNVMRIQYANTVRTQQLLDFDLLRPDLMTNQIVIQIMHYLHRDVLSNLRSILKAHFDWWLNDSDHTFHPEISVLQGSLGLFQDLNPIDLCPDNLIMLLGSLQSMLREQISLANWVVPLDQCLRIGNLFRIVNKWGLLWSEQESKERAVAIVLSDRFNTDIIDMHQCIKIMSAFARKKSRHNETVIEVVAL